MTDRVDDILSTIDAGLQSSPERGYQEPTGSANPAGCVRDNCRQPVDGDSDFCGPCRTFMLGDTDEDPVNDVGRAVPIPPVINRAEAEQVAGAFLDRISGYYQTSEPAGWVWPGEQSGGTWEMSVGGTVIGSGCAVQGVVPSESPTDQDEHPYRTRGLNTIRRICQVERRPMAMSVLVPVPWPLSDKPRIRVAVEGWRFKSRRFEAKFLYDDPQGVQNGIVRIVRAEQIGVRINVDGLTVELDWDYRIEIRDVELSGGKYTLHRITGTVVG